MEGMEGMEGHGHMMGPSSGYQQVMGLVILALVIAVLVLVRLGRIQGRWLGTPLDSPARMWFAIGALVCAIAHVPVTEEHVEEAPYMGVLFVVLTFAALALGLGALVNDSALVYRLGALTGGLSILGYILTRVVAFPRLGDDVGNWLEPLGVISVIAELMMVGAWATTRRVPVTSTQR